MPSKPPCPHGRQRYICKECGGKGICEHGRLRSQCKECGGSGICEHGRVRSRCKEGGTVGHVTILEATEVEAESCDEEEDFHDEAVLTVPAHIVLPDPVGPRGGKRKR